MSSHRFRGSSIRTLDTRRLVRLASTCVVLALGFFSFPAQAQLPGNPTVPEEGRWLAQDSDGVFLIGHCGKALCGSLIGMKYDGPVPRDVWGRSQCGLVMLTDFSLIRAENVWQGHILDPETGRTYGARIHAESPDVLKLRGFILGIPLFGKAQTWTRYHGTIGPECKLP